MLRNNNGYRYANICLFPTVSLSNGRHLTRLHDMESGSRGKANANASACVGTRHGRRRITATTLAVLQHTGPRLCQDAREARGNDGGLPLKKRVQMMALRFHYSWLIGGPCLMAAAGGPQRWLRWCLLWVGGVAVVGVVWTCDSSQLRLFIEQVAGEAATGWLDR